VVHWAHRSPERKW